MIAVSVILPNYNHAKFLDQRIGSILNQTFQDFELIILDDKSTDDSVAKLRTYADHPKVTDIIVNSKNSGSAFSQWLTGIERAQGKYIWIAESDDFVELNFLEVAIKSIEKSQSQLFYCRTVQVDIEGKFLRDLSWWTGDLNPLKWNTDYVSNSTDEIKDYLIWKNFICNASSVVFERTTAVQDYLKSLQGFRYCGDWLFWLKYLHDAKRISYSTETVNYWRDHAATTRMVNDFRRNEEVMKIYKWTVLNITGSENRPLLEYYFDKHIFRKSRKFFGLHLDFLRKNIKYSRLLLPILLKFYLFPKKFS